MKHRTSFVSNSSSCSFVIHKCALTCTQSEYLKKYLKEAEADGWSIWEDELKYEGSTSMDNYNMYDVIDRLHLPDHAYKIES